MKKLILSSMGKTFEKNHEGTWQYEIAPGRMCGCNIKTCIYQEKLLRAFEKAPRFVFEVVTEGYRGPMRRVGLTHWEADFADRMVRRTRPLTEKQKEVMKRIIIEMSYLRDNEMSIWNFLVPAELEGTTERKRFLRYIWNVADIRKLRDEEIMWLKEQWYGGNGKDRKN